MEIRSFNQFVNENGNIKFSVYVNEKTMFFVTNNDKKWFAHKANDACSEVYSMEITHGDIELYRQSHNDEQTGRFCEKSVFFLFGDYYTDDFLSDKEYYSWIYLNGLRVNLVDTFYHFDIPTFEQFKAMLMRKVSLAYAKMSPNSNGLCIRDVNGDVYDIPRTDKDFKSLYDLISECEDVKEFFLDFYEDYTDACNGCGDSWFIDVALTFKDLKGEKDEPKKLTKGYRWTAKSDDGSYEDESEVFATEKECYLNMRNAVLEKMKWNTEFEDVNECRDVYDYIGYKVKFNEKWIEHKSYSGAYIYKVEKVG